MATSLPAAVRELLEGKNFAHVATLMRDGSPQVTAVWIDVDGDRILVNTAEGRSRVITSERGSLKPDARKQNQDKGL